jgi:hypothetical protein
MLIDMENKIAAEKAKLDEWKAKQKMVKAAMDRLSRPKQETHVVEDKTVNGKE